MSSDAASTEAVPEAPVAPRHRGPPWDVLSAVAVGGALGAVLRYGFSLLWPHQPGTFPWAVLSINVVGCLLMGALMCLITETVTTHRLVRPFLGVGMLGGFTTLSTHVLGTMNLVAAGHPGTAVVYVLVTVFGALLAVLAGVRGTRLLLRRKGDAR
ncbi:fluoride efflux transporter FluC [Haloactinomyces albus]|uniref:Fluoride-specific ion channel FluC n=1 Tax=Haloactinomyces albus TaxID=1352928 RepID=A0AAE3ZDZ3_9ACTN|nr:CrcB family protein [Haloactinomyces albus]MDR7302071.1 CrcB protein [Haloactinomyces albus]